MSKRVRFELHENQVNYLRANYSDVPIVQKVLATEKELHFDISADDDADFFLWLDAESVNTLDEDYEATDASYMIESIIDFMHVQE